MQPDKSFGQSLRFYRQARDLTQAELAEQVNCATESIRKMEANRQRPSKFLAARLADSLGIPDEERAEFLSLARLMAAYAFQPSSPSGPHLAVVNLPAQMTSLVGRQDELTTACKELQKPDVRLITLTGPGGVGKTRLAAQIAREMLNDFPDGVYFVPLGSITDAALVTPAIARVLHIRTASNQFNAHFSSHFRHKSILLILDNFEHVMAATPLVAELLQSSHHLRILITSRSPLNLYGEHEINVQPLATPDLNSLPSWQKLIEYDSVRIFIERTRALNADFRLTEANAPVIAEICWRLDGLPLALELAAAYGKLFSPPMLLEHIKKGPIDLSSNAPNVPERHSALRNTIQWSYQLLDPVEQSVFQQLSIFVGGCTLEAAKAVCALESDTAMKYIGLLLDKSLLQRMDTATDERRYIMLETIRSSALERLQQSGDEEDVRQRHLAYYLHLAEEIAPKLQVGPTQRKWLEYLAREIGNLRIAIQWAIDHAGDAVVRLCNGLEYFWYEFGDPVEIYDWINAVLAQEINLSRRLKATALRFTGHVLMTMQIDYPRAQKFFEEALSLWKELDDQPEIADTLARLGIVALELGEYEKSQTIYEECLTICEALNDNRGIFWAREWIGVVWMRQGDAQQAQEIFETSAKWWRQQGDLQSEAFALNNLGAAAMYQGNYGHARVCQEQALAIWETIGDTRGTSSVLNALGPVMLYLGKPAEARRLLMQSLSQRWENQDYNGIAWNLERLAEIAFVQKQLERGAQLWGAAEALRERYNSPLFPAELHRYEPVLASAHKKLGEPHWNSACAIGRAKALEEVVNYALGKET